MSSRSGDNRRRRGGRGGYHARPKRQVSEQPEIDENSPVIQLFRGFQTELDKRHDKHERLVKLSRDITIDSKRAIFLLQRVPGTDAEKTLQEAETKFTEIRETKWRSVALELQNEDPNQFLRAYSAGLQEYVEAVSFWHYLKHDGLIDWPQIQGELVFPKTAPVKVKQDGASDADAAQDSSETKNAETDDVTTSQDPAAGGETPADDTDVTEVGADDLECEGSISVHVPPIEYMLGVADLTGELMRLAISAVGKGQLEKPHKICDFMRVIYDAFLSYGNVSRELSRKMSTLKQSLGKVENACYMLQVRGSEVPKHMLIEAISASHDEYGADGESP